MELKYLIKGLNQAVAKHFGNAFIAFLFKGICQTVLFSLIMLPLQLRGMRMLQGEAVSEPSLFLVVLTVFALFLAWALFQYGFCAMLLHMAQERYVTIGFIFLGFKKLRASLPIALLVAFLLTLITVCCVLGLLFFTDVQKTLVQLLANPDAAPASLAAAFDARAGLVLLGTALLFLLCFFLLALCFFSAAAHENASLKQVLSENRRCLRAHRLLLFRFLLAAGGRFLLISAGAFFLLAFVQSASAHPFISLFLNLVQLFNFYVALIRMSFALAAFYCAAVTETTLQADADRADDTAVINETIALLEHGLACDEQHSDAASQDGSPTAASSLDASVRETE